MTRADEAALERRKVAALERIADGLEKIGTEMAAKRPANMIQTPATAPTQPRVVRVEEDQPTTIVKTAVTHDGMTFELEDDEVEGMTDSDDSGQ